MSNNTNGMGFLNTEKIQKDALTRFVSATSGDFSIDGTDSVEKMEVRKRVIDNNDSIAMERILGENDLVPVAYLMKGFNVAKSVCRIIIRDKNRNTVGYGTGFLISSKILITNNHVLPDEESASFSILEFNFQNDENYMPCRTYYFELSPERLFITDENLDFTMVAVNDIESKGKTLSDFGYLRLLPDKGKILEGEYVSIIQHPKGGPKSVTLRENEIKYLFDDFIQYSTDTQPGSSGSPVFNDQWVVVGIHHSGVPDPDNSGEWIANEGIRISSIAKFIENNCKDLNEDKKALLKEVFPELDLNIEPDPDVIDDEEKTKGYNHKFFGENNVVPLPKLSFSMEEDVARMKNGKYVLDYVHFSLAICRSRGLAYYTAVNIDGKKTVKIKRGRDKWRFDPRISEEYQYGNEVYKNNDLDRGHLVRRNDPNWGEDAVQANSDTFHYTNAAPQHKNLNQKIWLQLEDYILHNASNYDLKVSVFTGPIFRESDMIYRQKYKIPEDFWKVVVMVKTDGKLSATAYLQTQENMLDNLEFVYGEYKTYQVPVKKIEELTGLSFGNLSDYDPIANLEFSALVISDESSIRL